jgi:predicted MPP superfamily phosphohydrolase
MVLALTLLALVGHGFLWAAFFNLTHYTSLPRWILIPLTVVGFAAAVLIPVGFEAWYLAGGLTPAGLAEQGPLGWLAGAYLALCWIAGGVTVTRWIGRRALSRPPTVLRHERRRLCRPLETADRTASDRRAHDFLTRLPGNQILQLEIAERAVEVPRLPPALDRLSIVHLSDLHFTGRVGRAYFEGVVRLANQLDADLVAITGDLLDESKCIDWVPDTLGKLTSRHGAYFVLGNHDLLVETDRLRRTLVEAGLVDLGGRWIEIRVRGEPVILAGNELPWIVPAADLEHAPSRSPNGGPLRIALSHSPDQLAWARRHDVDLLLAGHTHGGQICVPLVGPLLSATRLGANYASGIYHLAPTIVQITRGVSGRFPVRINCPPELTKLVLRSPARPST